MIRNFGQTGSMCNLKTYELYNYIIEQTRLNGGCSINGERHEPTNGYMVAIKGFGSDLMEMLNHKLEHNEYYGSWINPYTNQMEFDISINVDDIELAIKIGRENNQISIYDLNNGKEVRLDG